MATNKNNLPEEQDCFGYIHRPQGNDGACVSGTTGRYEIPSKTKKASTYFTGVKYRAGYQQDANGSDAQVPSRRKG